MDLQPHFEIAWAMLRYWMYQRRKIMRALFDTSCPARPAKIAAALNVKACRQFKSVIQLLEDGQAENAAVLARAMFETVMAMEFVLRRQFVPRTYDKKGRAKIVTVDSKIALTRNVRAALYLGYASMQQQRIGDRHQHRPGLKRVARQMLKGVDPRIMQELETEFGPRWRALLEKGRSYSGLSIANVARSLGKPFANWYHLVYPFQSDHVHASDPSDYIEFGPNNELRECWHSPPNKIRGTLETAITMFAATMITLNKHADLGPVTEMAIDGFYQRYERLLNMDQ